ncbi:hypothetical protein C8F01DRAFT_1281371 [Mycena amicta]|nr:hypothetical protein C8F01DRAFT_1281371 [Mycena amicta]
MLYPFGLHTAFPLSWSFELSHRGIFCLRSHECAGALGDGETVCRSCSKLRSDSVMSGVLARMLGGVHEASRFTFYGIGNLIELARRRGEQVRGLKLMKTNDVRRTMRSMNAMDSQNELTMAIASGNVPRVSRVLAAGLRNNAGIHGLLDLCRRATMGKYRPNSDVAEQHFQLVMLRLGGARLADIAHRSLGLPSLTTTRRKAVLTKLLPCTGKPTVADIERNIDAYYEAYPDESGVSEIVHQIIGIDELAIQPRARILGLCPIGVCRQHCNHVPLRLETEADLKVFATSIKEKRGHLASEATVAVIGILSDDPQMYSARPILFSGDCKQESGAEHAANILRPLLTAVYNKSKHGNKTYRPVSVASDGESRRGKAMAIEYMKYQLSPDSPIYPLLSSLEFLDLSVGIDDITPDKDYKHGFKCSRNLVMREAGVEIEGFRITRDTLREHLLTGNSHSQRTVDAWLNPNDKQDVVLALGLHRAIWMLGDAGGDATPLFRRARAAIQAFGRFLFNLITPYIDPTLDLGVQLTRLSCAAHLLFHLYSEGETRFMPKQTFVNLMIQIKNVYFCCAKAKVDRPTNKFYLILLGTDRVEHLFGLIRTAVGTDVNVDLLQLADRASNIAEVASILAIHPEWDRGSRRLKLNALDDGTVPLESKVDHLNPRSLTGDLTVARVHLATSWIGGRSSCESIAPKSSKNFKRLSQNRTINMLAPSGVALVDSADDEIESELVTPPAENPTGDDAPQCSNEAEHESSSSRMVYRGGEMTRSKALRIEMEDVHDPAASTDRARRIISKPRHQATVLDTDDGILGRPCIRVDNPVCTILRCEEKLFLAIGAVYAIHYDSRAVDDVLVELLADPATKISIQLMSIVRRLEEDASTTHDWIWSGNMDRSYSNIPGRFVQPLNPTISVLNPDEPTYIFSTPEMLGFSVSLLEKISREDIMQSKIPKATRSGNFPYRDEGRACFVCEHDTNGRVVDLEPDAKCQRCTPPFPLDLTHGQRVLEHAAAHLLHDRRLNRDDELCGLCLRPSPLCVFYLRKGNGKSPQIEWKTSKCLYPINFQYGAAATFKEAAPSSNVPVVCPLCTSKKPAVWKYNLPSHYQTFHNLQNPASWPTEVDVVISAEERDGLKQVWVKRKKPKKSRPTKRPDALQISEVHSSRLAFRNSDAPEQDRAEPSELTATDASASTLFIDRPRELPELLDSDGEEDEALPPTLTLHGLTARARQRIDSDDSDSDNIDSSTEDSLFPIAEGVLHLADNAMDLGQLQDVCSEASDTASIPVPHPMVSALPAAIPSAIQVSSNSTAVTGKRKRTVRVILDASGCDGCGSVLSPAEQANPALSIECALPGCETRWVSTFNLSAP